MLAQKMIAGEEIRNRNKRSMAISALRSWLFNEYVSSRLADNYYTQPLAGDVMSLAGSNSFFSAQLIDEKIIQRLALRDIQLSAPMWGAGELPSKSDAAEYEHRLASKHPQIRGTLEDLGLRQERRVISLYADNMAWELKGSQLRVSFVLPSGSFATSILREVVDVSQPSVME